MTALSNVHPEVLAKIQAKLPKGAKIVAAMAESDTSSIFMVEHDGKTRRVPMPKANVDQIFHQRSAEVSAHDGDTWDSVMKTFSDKYKLNLLPGVDFVIEGTESDRVVFEGAPEVRLGVGFLPDSITLTGGVTILVKNKDAQKRPTTKVVPMLETQVLGLALASNILDGKGKTFSGSQFSNAFSKKVIALFKSLKLNHKLSVDDIGTAEVIEDADDGISRIAVIKTLKGVILAVRYTSTDEDRPF